jgi:hypothetical protein
MVSESPNNARSCGGPDDDVRSLRVGVCNTPVSYFGTMSNSHIVRGL